MALLLPPSLATAQDDVSASPPPVQLDRLLKLPSDLRYDTERRGGATRAEWQQRFEDAYQERDSAAVGLAEAQAELEEISGTEDAWTFSPPGLPSAGDSSDAPLSHRLRKEIDRHSEDLQRAQARLRDLDVEANLAGVPDAWRGAPSRTNSTVANDSGTPRGK